MFMLARRRREAERQKKLEEAFREADENGNGRITPQQMIKLFAANDCAVPNIEEEAADLAKDGWIQRHDFLRFACTTELLKVEFQDRVFQKVQVDDKKDDRGSKKDSKKLDPSKMDRVELAFRKFDTNNDGYLSRDEFDVMMKNISKEQADRIFRSLDTKGDNRVSLEEFRAMLDRGKDLKSKAAAAAAATASTSEPSGAAAASSN